MKAYSYDCNAEDFHPYECDGPGKCRHCDRRRMGDHDPRTCPLCEDGREPEPGIIERTIIVPALSALNRVLARFAAWLAK